MAQVLEVELTRKAMVKESGQEEPGEVRSSRGVMMKRQQVSVRRGER